MRVAEDRGFSQIRGSGAGSLSLLRELQSSLYEIARYAELASDAALQEIQVRSEAALRLIDSCLTTAQIEAGQLTLELIPCGVGSVMHEAAHELRALSGVPVGISSQAHQPAMTNPGLLKNMLFAAGSALNDSAGSPLEIRSFSAKQAGIGVGVFAQNFDFSSAEFRQALEHAENRFMPLSRHSSKSGVLILLADSIARALGGGLELKTLGKMRGFATVLPPSRQLALV